jgi:hypothetical protein
MSNDHEEPLISLTIPHDAAVAIAAASIHYQVWLTGLAEIAPTIQHLDQVYHLIMQQPQLSPPSREMLRDMRLLVAGQKDE